MNEGNKIQLNNFNKIKIAKRKEEEKKEEIIEESRIKDGFHKIENNFTVSEINDLSAICIFKKPIRVLTKKERDRKNLSLESDNQYVVNHIFSKNKKNITEIYKDSPSKLIQQTTVKTNSVKKQNDNAISHEKNRKEENKIKKINTFNKISFNTEEGHQNIKEKNKNNKNRYIRIINGNSTAFNGNGDETNNNVENKANNNQKEKLKGQILINNFMTEQNEENKNYKKIGKRQLSGSNIRNRTCENKNVNVNGSGLNTKLNVNTSNINSSGFVKRKAYNVPPIKIHIQNFFDEEDKTENNSNNKDSKKALMTKLINNKGFEYMKDLEKNITENSNKNLEKKIRTIQDKGYDVEKLINEITRNTEDNIAVSKSNISNIKPDSLKTSGIKKNENSNNKNNLNSNNINNLNNNIDKNDLKNSSSNKKKEPLNTFEYVLKIHENYNKKKLTENLDFIKKGDSNIGERSTKKKKNRLSAKRKEEILNFIKAQKLKMKEEENLKKDKNQTEAMKKYISLNQLQKYLSLNKKKSFNNIKQKKNPNNHSFNNFNNSTLSTIVDPKEYYIGCIESNKIIRDKIFTDNDFNNNNCQLNGPKRKTSGYTNSNNSKEIDDKIKITNNHDGKENKENRDLNNIDIPEEKKEGKVNYHISEEDYLKCKNAIEKATELFNKSSFDKLFTKNEKENETKSMENSNKKELYNQTFGDKENNEKNKENNSNNEELIKTNSCKSNSIKNTEEYYNPQLEKLDINNKDNKVNTEINGNENSFPSIQVPLTLQPNSIQNEEETKKIYTFSKEELERYENIFSSIEEFLKLLTQRNIFNEIVKFGDLKYRYRIGFEQMIILCKTIPFNLLRILQQRQYYQAVLKQFYLPYLSRVFKRLKKYYENILKLDGGIKILKEIYSINVFKKIIDFINLKEKLANNIINEEKEENISSSSQIKEKSGNKAFKDDKNQEIKEDELLDDMEQEEEEDDIQNKIYYSIIDKAIQSFLIYLKRSVFEKLTESLKSVKKIEEEKNDNCDDNSKNKNENEKSNDFPRSVPNSLKEEGNFFHKINDINKLKNDESEKNSKTKLKELYNTFPEGIKDTNNKSKTFDNEDISASKDNMKISWEINELKNCVSNRDKSSLSKNNSNEKENILFKQVQNDENLEKNNNSENKNNINNTDNSKELKENININKIKNLNQEDKEKLANEITQYIIDLITKSEVSSRKKLLPKRNINNKDSNLLNASGTLVSKDSNMNNSLSLGSHSPGRNYNKSSGNTINDNFQTISFYSNQNELNNSFFMQTMPEIKKSICLSFYQEKIAPLFIKRIKKNIDKNYSKIIENLSHPKIFNEEKLMTDFTYNLINNSNDSSVNITKNINLLKTLPILDKAIKPYNFLDRDILENFNNTLSNIKNNYISSKIEHYKIINECLFDSTNEIIESERAYGEQGNPFKWSLRERNVSFKYKDTPFSKGIFINKTIKKLTKLIYTKMGLIPENYDNFDMDQLTTDRDKKFIESIKEDLIRTDVFDFDVQETFINLQLSKTIFNQLINEVIEILEHIQFSRRFPEKYQSKSIYACEDIPQLDFQIANEKNNNGSSYSEEDDSINQ